MQWGLSKWPRYEKKSKRPWTSTLAAEMSLNFCVGSTRTLLSPLSQKTPYSSIPPTRLTPSKQRCPERLAHCRRPTYWSNPTPTLPRAAPASITLPQRTVPAQASFILPSPTLRVAPNRISSPRCITKPIPGTTCRARLHWNWVTPSTRWLGIYGTRATVRVGHFTRSVWPMSWVFTPPPSIVSVCTPIRSREPRDWSWTAACTRWVGRANKRSTT